MIPLVICLAALVPLGMGVHWLVETGIADGDRPEDAWSEVTWGPDGTVVIEVVNPGLVPVPVGCDLRWSRGPRWARRLTPDLVVRPARWHERRRPDRGASVLLGAVEGGSWQQWRVPDPATAAHVVVVVGQGGGRLRMRDHARPSLA